MNAITIPKTLNLIFSGGMILAVLLQSLVMPVVLQGHAWLMALIVMLLIPLNTPFWSLIHESIHKNFHSDKTINELAGRAMSVLFGASFYILRFGHLMHHQYNRDWESEYYVPGKQNKALMWLKHYFTMLGGLYLSETAMTLLTGLLPSIMLKKIAPKIFPDERHQQAVHNFLLKPETLKKIRSDLFLIAVFYTGAFFLFAQNWPVLLFLLAGRAVSISLMDNAYHYGTPLDNSVIAKELKVSGTIAKFILNFNHHQTHHKNTRLPWTDLPEHRVIQGNDYAENLGGALFGQFKGPLKTDSK